ncbi:MAG: 50S ribosomal protein L22 [Candidatus Sumerlaeia bacterium]|jgi:large subunit ribosomal protein L22|nr:50S ribosomal protein L22 [Candidatus Sumerlaeia bacterium]
MGRNAIIRKERKLTTQDTTQSGEVVVSRASAKYIHCAPRKIKLVADQIRNKTVTEALEILNFLHRPSAVPYVLRVLDSAVANAEKKAEEGQIAVIPEPDKLVIGEIRVEGAPMMKRIRPASMGRAVRIRKRLSHIHLKLIES